MNLRNVSKREFQTVEGPHAPGKIKEYSDKLGKAMKARYEADLDETTDAPTELRGAVKGSAKAAAVATKAAPAPTQKDAKGKAEAAGAAGDAKDAQSK